MKNLEQIRARNALTMMGKYCDRKKQDNGDEDEESKYGDALTGFPALIIDNGLLAALAYGWAKKKQHLMICNDIAQHLASDDIRLVGEMANNVKGLLDYLKDKDSTALRLCTAEALAFLNYLRRFVKADKHGDKK